MGDKKWKVKMLLSEKHRYSILFAVDLLNVEMAKKKGSG